MSLDELTETHRPAVARGQVCVVIAGESADSQTRRCIESVLAQTPANVFVTLVDPAVRAITRALELLAPADVALLCEPCVVTAGWLEAMRSAAYDDTTTATASALSSYGTPLALGQKKVEGIDLDKLASSVAGHTMRLRPRLGVIVGPCVYLRRDALELVGSLNDKLELHPALYVDYAQRCLLSGLAHVTADDVVVAPFEPAVERALSPQLHESYPFLSDPPALAASGTLSRSLEAVRGPLSKLSVTVDVRALNGDMTGTQRHILELVKALAATRELDLRLLVSPDIDPEQAASLRSLPDTKLLLSDTVDNTTRPSTVFHRPQQVFSPADMRLALRLGERIVMSQLDLIAYRNPGYHSSATAWLSHRRVTRQALAAGDRVVVSSEHTRSELLSDGLTDDDRIRIVPPGLDHTTSIAEAAPPYEPASLLSELADFDPIRPGHRDGYLLCLGTDFRHKNRLFALRMLEALHRYHDWHGGLILAGMHIPNGSSLEAEREFVNRHPSLQATVRDLGAIGEQEKNRLTSRASAVLYPSTYEGFGLIPFEAALSGTPCAFASQSSLSDVLPQEAATILPWDPRESAAALLKLLRDEAARARHLELLVGAASRHTWAGAAETMTRVFHEAALAPVREAAKLSRDEIEREHEMHELIAAHDELVARLVFEREHTQGMYNQLNQQVGFALGLIGPEGALPEDVQRALLALSARPRLSRPLYGAASHIFRLMRALGRGRRG